MKRISLSCLAILASVAALGSAGPAGVASAVELSGSAASPSSVSAQSDPEGAYAASVDFHVTEGIVLGEPEPLTGWGTSTMKYPVHEGNQGAGFAITFDSWADASVSWPILPARDGAKSAYTLTAKINPQGIYSWWSCEVKDANGQVTNAYRCSMDRRGSARDWDLHVTTDARTKSRVAEASGTVKTKGAVSLAQGVYTTESGLHVDGATEVPKAKSTQFDAVYMDDDNRHLPAEKNTARMTFKYALLQDGEPVIVNTNAGRQQLFVKGNVSNHRGDYFEGGSSCDFVTADDKPYATVSYSCDKNSYYGGAVMTDGRAQYITDFTVSNKN
jgi:hypothetical protein